MQSRQSIPNVGRRAQGRKALFMLRGNGVSSIGSLPQDTDDSIPRTGHPITTHSLLVDSEVSDDEQPVSSDESMLSRPSHPYNRIIQSILHRHRATDHKDPEENAYSLLTPRIKRDHGQWVPGDTPPTSISGDSHTSSDIIFRGPQSPKSDDEERQQNIKDGIVEVEGIVEREGGEKGSAVEAEAEHKLQWVDILRADHGVSEASLDLSSCNPSPMDDQSLSSLDLARGYLTDRGARHGSQASSRLSEQAEDGSLDTTRSEPQTISSLPRLGRKRDLQPLDDMLDYFWVYQGMTRQVLDRHSPVNLWNRGWFKKKPTKLPPLYISTGSKNGIRPSERTTSRRLGSQETDTQGSGETPREKKPTCVHSV